MTTHERQEPGHDLLPLPRVPAEEREIADSRDSLIRRRHGKYDKHAEEDGGYRPVKDGESTAC